MKTYTGLIENLPENGIFVFGANTQGIHGAGTAKIALEKYGAKLGLTHLQGQSYGLITTDLTSEVRPGIKEYQIVMLISELYFVANENPDKDFYVAYTAGGFNLSGFTSDELAWMFAKAGLFGMMHQNVIPDNMVFEDNFYKSIILHQEDIKANAKNLR